jgi:SSS family solute:Na+ symporter
MFGAIDWAVLVLYMAVSLFVGLWASRGAKGFKGYTLGGGSMPWVAIGISLIATSVSSTTFLGTPAEAFGGDMTLILTNVGSLVSIVVVGFLFIPRLRGQNVGSAYELLERHFSRPVRRLAALLYSLHLVLRMGILLFAPSLVLSGILGVSLESAILLSAVVAILYTWHGGFRAVVWTDVLQFTVFFGGGLLALFLAVDGIGGWGKMASLASEAGKTHWLDLSMNPAQANTLLSLGVAYAVLEVAIRGCDPQFVQRYLSLKSTRAANASSVLSMVLGALVSLLFYWLGAALFVYYQVSHVGVLPAGTGVNDVFPFFIVNALPTGVKGILVAAIYAASMSSISSAINALAGTTEKDILCKAEGEESVKRTKWLTVFWGVLSVGGALLAASQEGSILKNALFFTGLFTGPLLALFLLAFFAPGTRPFAVLLGVACGMASLLLFNGVPFIPAYQPPLAGVFSWPWNPLVSCSFAIWIALAADLVAPRRGVDRVA